MKTNHLIPLLLALLTLGACVSPQDEASDCQECNEQQIVIKLASDNAPATRAGRPLTSNQPNQDVDRVMLIVCKGDNSIVYTKLLTDWMTTSDIYIDQNDRRGREDVVKLEGEELLPVGDYKVYAIAYTYKGENNGNNTQYTVKGKADDGTTDMNLNDYCEGLKNFEDGSKFTDNFTLSLTDAPGEELFAGSQEFTANAAGFATEVVLNRQVAGVYLYVKDIPYYDNLARLRLMPATDNDGLVLGRFANEDIAGNGNETQELYVMNGTDAKADTEAKQALCEINLTDWFTDGKITRGGNLISTDNWKQSDKLPANMKVQPGSFFGGSFVIPFAASAENTKSLVIEMVSNTDGTEEVKKQWSVKLPAKDLSNKIFAWNSTGFVKSTVIETVTNYSLLRNHLYCIGNKFTDTGEDLPQSLYTEPDILLTVIAEWDIIYDMVLEPDPDKINP